MRDIAQTLGDMPRATLATRAAEALVGRPIDTDALDLAEAALAQDLEPHADLQASADTRLALARVLLRRVIAQLLPALPIAA